jgi:hypothetical protein
MVSGVIAPPALIVAERRQRRTERFRGLIQSQFGVISWGQLLGLSFSEREIRTLLDSGQIRRVHRGGYAIGALELTQAGRFLAAVLAIGEVAVLSHRSAAAYWGFLPISRAHVHVSTTRAVRSRNGIRVHQVRGSLDGIRRRGMPITSPDRTLVDLAGSNLPDESLERAVHEAEVQRRVSVPSLLSHLAEAPPRPGVRRLRRLITPGPAPTRNRFEDRVLELTARHGLPRPLCNTVLHGVARGRLLRVHDTSYALARDPRRKQAWLEEERSRTARRRGSAAPSASPLGPAGTSWRRPRPSPPLPRRAPRRGRRRRGCGSCRSRPGRPG